MIRLSVIIVNYNVRHFLEQCLNSVLKACQGIEAEIIVVDNDSFDGSVEYIGQRFPQVRIIANKKNVGFSKANNQGIRIAQGEYVLLLNPDTLVEETTFRKCLDFMDAHPDGGGLGVKMVDGQGHFLPESKRGLPTPWTAFYKIFGLAALFPQSKRLGKYHLSYLDKEHVHVVDVLSGAFMWMRKSVLEKVGLLDETFFMYGEDIDLSYRITIGGYKNYYFPGTTIVHYKGESTKRASANYVFMFYKAMLIFAEKHFRTGSLGFMNGLIQTAVYLRALYALLVRFLKAMALPALDAGLIWLAMFLIKEWWEVYSKSTANYYPGYYMTEVVPAYLIVWILAAYLYGNYDRPYKLARILAGAFWGTLFISAVTNFLDEYRFSKALIIMGGAATAAIMTMVRLGHNYVRTRKLSLSGNLDKTILIAGSPAEAMRVTGLIDKTQPESTVIGWVNSEETLPANASTDRGYLGNLDHLEEIVDILKPAEVIFCAADIPANSIIEWMSSISQLGTEFKISTSGSDYIIGSNTPTSIGEIYSVELKLGISSPTRRRQKRVIDFVTSILLLLTLPLNIWFVRNGKGFITNIYDVLSGRKTWVGLSKPEYLHQARIKPGVITPATALQRGDGPVRTDINLSHSLDMKYAKNYQISQDVQLILRCFSYLGNRAA